MSDKSSQTSSQESLHQPSTSTPEISKPFQPPIVIAKTNYVLLFIYLAYLAISIASIAILFKARKNVIFDNTTGKYEMLITQSDLSFVIAGGVMFILSLYVFLLFVNIDKYKILYKVILYTYVFVSLIGATYCIIIGRTSQKIDSDTFKIRGMEMSDLNMLSISGFLYLLLIIPLSIMLYRKIKISNNKTE